MAIRFYCKNCHRLLGIASRKAGTPIECPECGTSQVVPDETATALTAISEPAASGEAVEEASELRAFDDLPVTGEPSGESPAQPIPPSTTSAPGPTTPESQPGPPVPQEMILFKRQTLYVQAILFLVVGCFGLAAGYLIGRGDASFEHQFALEEAAREPVLIDGRLVYDPGTGNIAGDAGSVIIALPEGRFPDKKLSIRGIRPQDPRPPEKHMTLRMIGELGGAHTRADASGTFSMVVPQQGGYWLLIVSGNTLRPKGSEIDEVDLDQMERYFLLTRSLINRNKYRWTLEEVSLGLGPVEHNFGRSEEERPPAALD